ncbi:MAG: methyl-accepting chemotaxis protein, partial [Butyrivibrio sp.]|nr:methyl-accepting chemotaxis protein [Butyrivibrio sp.]
MASDTGTRKQKKKMMESVKTRLSIIVIAIMAIPLIITTIINYISSHAEAVDNMNTINNAQVNLVERDFSAVVAQNRQILYTIALSTTVQKFLKGELDADAVITWLQDTDKTVGDGNVLVVVGPDGMQVAKSSGDCVDVSDREYFKQVKSTKAFYVSDQNISKTTGARICTFIYPVLDTDGTFLGAVQRNYNLSVFTELVKKEIQAEKQDIFIGDNNGDLIAHTSMNLDTGEPVNFASQQWFTASRSNREATGSYSSKFNGGNWRMAYQRDPVTGWVTVVASDVDVALASANRMLNIVIAIGLVMLALAIVCALYLSNSFTKPILAVNDAISKLSDGEFAKLNDRNLLARKDEFGDIVKNINSLIDTLSHVVENIKKASVTVTEQARELTETSGQISNTTDDVSNAVQE